MPETKTLIGYKLTRPDCHGWIFCGTTPDDVARAVKAEVEANEGGDIEDSAIHLEAFEITQAEIDAMPEFQGW